MLEAHAARLDRLALLLAQQQHLQGALRGIAERLTMQHGAYETLLRDLAQRQTSPDDLLRQLRRPSTPSKRC
jgi:hypothetical protein